MGVLRAQLELGQIRQEIDRRVAEKEDEFNNTRKNHARAMDSIGASIETEQRAKGEALRVKKQLEGEINELEIGLDHANKANAEGLKSIKRYQSQLRETIQLFEDEARSRAQIAEQVGISERKAAALSGEVEESKHFWMEPTGLSINSKETLLMLGVLLTICRQSMDVT